MEEEKVVNNEQQVPAQNPAQAKNALMAFILSLVGFGTDAIPFVSIASIILGCIALKLNRAAAGITRKPHAIFQKISKPFAIIDIVLGIIMTIVWLIVFAIVPILVAAGLIAAETAA